MTRGEAPFVARFEDGAYTTGEAIMLVFTVAIVLTLELAWHRVVQ